MQISTKAWVQYITKMSKISQKAADLMQAYVQKHGFDDDKALLDYAFALSQRYGQAIGSLSCSMYEATAAAQGVTVPTAEIADLPEYGEVAKAVHGTMKRSQISVPSTVARLVKQVGADTTLKNAMRDGAQFAWVPHGDTCSFCITLASRGWQYMSKKALKNGHAEHIHANCDCQYAVRFDGKSGVRGYDPDKYLKEYNNAGGDINAMRRMRYKGNKDAINARKRELYAEQHRRKIGKQGQEIIDMPTYNKLTKDFLKNGGLIVKGEEAVKHLEKQGAYASYFMGGNFAFIRDDATVSDVLEEMYHALQDRKNMFAEYSREEMLIRREIDAQKYLLSVAERYKVPIEEIKVTKQNLANYEEQLKERLNGKGGQKE